MLQDLGRVTFAQHDDQSIAVYQAFGAEIAEEALGLGHFGPRFKLSRMSWIKPSFGWMLHRSGYATKSNQTRILQLAISKSHFIEAVQLGVATSFEASGYASRDEWRQALNRSDVRIQWDPDRDWQGRVLERKAIQVGLRGDVLRQYAKDWILQMRDVTEIAHAAMASRGSSHPPRSMPDEAAWEIGVR